MCFERFFAEFTLSEWCSFAPEANGLRMTDGKWLTCAITYDAMYICAVSMVFSSRT